MAKKKSRAAHWQRVIERGKGSGLSGAEYCRREGISYGTYSWWKHQLGRNGSAKVGKASRPALVPVRVVDRPAPVGSRALVEVGLSGGRLVRIHAAFDPEALAKLVGALEAGAC